MATISDFMTNNHRECDDLFAAAEVSVSKGRWQQAQGEFETFRNETERHLKMEEEVLFPEFDARTGMDMGPTFVMRTEHRQMRGVLADMAQAMTEKDGESYLGLSDTLMILMQQHNMKEEQMLYRMMDQALGADAAPLLERAAAALD